MFKKSRLTTFSGLLILTIILSFGLRVVNPTFGFPVLYTVPDEVPNYLTAFEMLEKRQMVASPQYPPLGSLVMTPFIVLSYMVMRLTGQVSSLTNFELLLTTHEGYFLFIPRIISAVFGTAAVFVIYRIALSFFPKQKMVAFWSSVLLAFSVTQVQQSHIGKPWLGALFFCELGLYFLLADILEKKEKNYRIILSALFFVIALGFHFAAGIFFILFIVLHFWLFRKKSRHGFRFNRRYLMTYSPTQASGYLTKVLVGLCEPEHIR